ncbi:MAG: phenylacetate--CoA ligase [Clostridiales bacterium]|jgi:phenylacetate-CoA ligase|nr:phenylacetate--CoA ligase [Clostridiales bacterium]
MGNYWNKTIETMHREELRKLQAERLKRTVDKIYTNVPYYREKMQVIGLLPGDIKTVDDLKKLPFTTKQDLRDNYPFGMFAVPMDEIVRIHASSGTTGKQTVVGYTGRDIEVWSECMARCLVMAGQDHSSRVQVSYGYGLFTGGLGAHYGAERIGASVIPTSSGNTARQINVIRDFGTTCICCTPSYALYIAETMEEMGIRKEDIKLTAGIFGAEPWTVGMRKELEQRLGIRAHDIYGLSEIMGPSVAQDCEFQNGLHVWEDCYIPEIIDPETGAVLPEGSAGEIVFTTINKEGIPLIRYRTRDISSLSSESCDCGRTHIRMSKPTGRSDDMLIIRGVNVFPSQIESVLMEMGEAAPHYRLIIEREGMLDTMTVEIEVSDALFSDYVKGIEGVESSLKKQIESLLGVACKVRLVEPKTIERSEGKAKRVIDKRNLI